MTTRSVFAILVAAAIGCAYGSGFAGASQFQGQQQEPAGKAPYEANCRKCHGVRGVPPKTMKAKFPKIATFDADFFSKRSDDSVVTVLTKGKGDDMKSFKEKMTHEQMVAVAAYIRDFVPKS